MPFDGTPVLAPLRLGGGNGYLPQFRHRPALPDFVKAKRPAGLGSEPPSAKPPQHAGRVGHGSRPARGRTALVQAFVRAQLVQHPGPAALGTCPALLCDWGDHASRPRATAADRGRLSCPATGDTWTCRGLDDDPSRTHAEVIAALDAALLAVQMPA